MSPELCCFNLDHVLVARSDGYVVETKPCSKRDTGQTKIVFTGDMLIYQNGVKSYEALIQVVPGLIGCGLSG